MEFGDWLVLSESKAVADSLRSYDKFVVQKIKEPIRIFLRGRIPTKIEPLLVNFFASLYLTDKISPEVVPTQISHDWQNTGDYIVANMHRRELFARVMTRHNLETRVADYHRNLELAAKNRRKGPEGHPIVNVEQSLNDFFANTPFDPAQLPKTYLPSIWRGWNWVSLGTGRSRDEAAAGGHCGNEGASPGDNILSLRGPNGKVHLTFIVNTYTGQLGEAKALNNKKPSKGYHPAIVSLLLSPYISDYQGGGYLQENNFHPNDIEDELLRQYLTDNLVKQHDIPENYLPVNWVEQWTQPKIDALPPEEKLEVLLGILKVFENHKPLRTHEYRGDESVMKAKSTLPKIHFNINKLLREVIANMKDIQPRTALGVLESVDSIKNSNEIGHWDDMKLFHPDKIRDIERKEFWDKQDEWQGLVKSKELRIDESIFEEFTRKVIRKIKQYGGVREKAALIESLEDIGYRDEQPDPKDWATFKEWNVYDEDMKSLRKDIIDHVIKNNKIPGGMVNDIQNCLNELASPIDRKWIEWFQLTADGKKVMISLNLD
jgi:hypothetical protein